MCNVIYAKMRKFVAINKTTIIIMGNKMFAALTAFALMSVSVIASAADKVIKIPTAVGNENKFGQPDGSFDMEHKAESANLVIFWDKSFGTDPTQYADESRRFDPKAILAEGERFYNFYIDNLHFADRENSESSKYKMIIWMHNDDDGTAYGWGDEGVGMMWFRPVRAKAYPYCTLAHEMGHSFQCIVGADGGRGFPGSPIVEYTSQWMLWQVYPDWTEYEKFHLDAYMDLTHHSLFHPANMYHAPQFMEYWSNKHGQEMVGRMWRESKEGEDPVATYKRLAGLDQQAFNDEIYEAASHFVAWDIPRVKEKCHKYINQHKCSLEPADAKGRYRISASHAPQNYGYNAIRLDAEKGKKIVVDFEGLAGAEGYNSVRTDLAGWRYGLVTVDKAGNCTYGPMSKARNGKNKSLKFKVPADAEYVWLVVTGAPADHSSDLLGQDCMNAQWPYALKLKNATVHQSMIADAK